MIKNGYTSRSIPSAEKFEQVYNQRLAAKKAGDKATANALKLVVNTCYGGTLNSYNDLYDPLMARSVCISGQLYLVELAEHLYKDIPGLEIVALNTDSIMIMFEEEQYDDVMVIINEWQERTHFVLEEDKVQYIAAANVNNYTMIVDGHDKCKGGILVRGIAPAGAFNINNQAVIVAEAVREYFLRGTPVADTINACDDISKFQLIAKAGAKYRDASIMYGGKSYPVQRVNRVYASSDPLAGRLTKVKIADDSEALIASMPDHCVIDNRNILSITDIDKQWYIDLAQKRINDFKGIKPEKKGRKPMAEKKTSANAFARLLDARVMFLDAHIDKSGKHMQMKYKYFELDDIVPVATRIFQKVGLIPIDIFDKDSAVINIVNVDDPGDVVTFSVPFTPWIPNEKIPVNNLQVMGASITYYRRYLYMLALDICTPDEIDSTSSLPDMRQSATPAAVAPATVKPVEIPKPAEAPKAAAPVTPAIPVTPAETPKAEAPAAPVKPMSIKLTAGDGAASELQVKQLKEALKKLRDAKVPGFNEYLQQVALDTRGFTAATKVQCEKLMLEIKGKLAQ